MNTSEQVKNAKEQIRFVEKEVVEVIGSVEKALVSCPPESESTLRLMGIPILYSVWERLFSIGNGVCIRLLIEADRNSSRFSVDQRAFWLLKEPFYESFTKKIRVDHPTVDISIKLLNEIERFHGSPLRSHESEKILVTKSNVNHDVVVLNAKLINITTTMAYKRIDFSRLDELVGRRNGIGHGNNISPPGKKEFEELLGYTKMLVSDYSKALLEWIRSTQKNSQKKKSRSKSKKRRSSRK